MKIRSSSPASIIKELRRRQEIAEPRVPTSSVSDRPHRHPRWSDRGEDDADVTSGVAIAMIMSSTTTPSFAAEGIPTGVDVVAGLLRRDFIAPASEGPCMALESPG